jgi:hypothetical protein
MGANAQTTVPAFTAGQVLTAEQQTQINTGIPVFATTTTRDAAFGGTGEKTLAEGQFAYIEATDTTQYYDGSAWQTVGITPGLRFVSSATFSAAATVSLAASTFTSSYANYRIIFIADTFSAAASLTMRMRVGGVDSSAASYEYSIIGYDTGGTLNGIQATGQTSAIIGYAVTSGIGLSMDIYNPQATANTRFILNSYGKNASTTTPSPQMGGGSFAATTSFDAVSFISSSNMTGRYAVYAYNQ